MVRAYSILVFGEHGCGKTYFSYTFPGKIAVVDLERKADNCKRDFFANKDIDIFDCWKIEVSPNGEIKDDAPNTLKAVDQAIMAITKNINNYNTIVLDGSSKLRAFAEVEWSKKNGKKVFGVKANTDVNNRLRNIFNPFISFSRFYNKHVIITAEIKGKYEPTGRVDELGYMEQEAVGVVADLKKFVAYGVDIVIYMRIMELAKFGKVRVSSFDKHAIIGDVNMNIGFIDFSFKKMVKVHQELEHNKEELKKLETNPRYVPRLTKIESLFGDESFNLLEIKERMKNCIHCGSKIDKDVNLCTRCGKEQQKGS